MNHQVVEPQKSIVHWLAIQVRRGRAVLGITLTAIGLLIGLSLLTQSGVARINAQPLDNPRTIIVTSAVDGGPGTLRWALTSATISDTILFDTAVFPPADPVTISLSSALPTIITDNLTVDASEAGVILDGNGLTTGSGFEISGARGVTIRGLQILHFPDQGVVVQAGATQTLIGGDRAIGSGPLGQGNLISGNGKDGVLIQNSGTTSNVIQGNLIGTDITGRTAYSNGGDGVEIASRATGNLVGGIVYTSSLRNLVSGNHFAGVKLSDTGTKNNIVQGNYIGTDIDGKYALANDCGVVIISRASNNVIGGNNVAARNLISGNGAGGVHIEGTGTMSNTVKGNYIGTDATGSNAIPNKRGGIAITYRAQHNIIGGRAPGEANLISGNEQGGISIQGGNTTNNTVLSNTIGLDASGLTALPNKEGGIRIDFGASNNMIGDGTRAGANIVSGNQGSGIVLAEHNTVGNEVRGNYIGTIPDGTLQLGNQAKGIEIQIDTNDNVIEGNYIYYNEAEGVEISYGATDNYIENNTVSHNGAEGIGVSYDATSNHIRNNHISSNNNGGILISQPASTGNMVSGNSVLDNGGLALKLVPGNVVTENVFSGNLFNYAQVTGGVMTDQDETWGPQGDLDTFLVVEDDLTVSPGVTWTLAPGTHVQFDYGLGATISGTLIAAGNDGQPVRLTSAERYAFPLPGDWQGLTFMPGSSGTLRQASVEFAANGLTLQGGTVSVVSSTIAASQQDGILVHTGTLSLQGNTLAGNGAFAINNQAEQPIDASAIWWGHASGPDGLGDPVQGQVTYENWRTEPEINDGWRQAMVLNPGRHSFSISHYRDLEWFRVPVGTRNATLDVTLTHLPQDYDLLLFSQLGSGGGDAGEIGRSMYTGSSVHIGRSMYTADVDEAGQLSDIGRSMYTGQLADVGQAFGTGNLLQVSTHAGHAGERVSTGVWNQSGWYHLLVAGHNGANDPTVSYTLQVTVTPGAPSMDPTFEAPVFEPPSWVSPTVKTLILTHRGRLERRYGTARTMDLWGHLDALAVAPEVAGRVVALDAYSPISQTYGLWTENITNPVHANLTAATIKALLAVTRTAYPNLENLLIIGDDDILPFRRIPDEVGLANEASYNAYLSPETALAAGLRERYFLSDDYYADFDPLPWRGRGLYLADYAVGRLVETPEEMSTAIQAFLTQPVLTATTGLVVGYDFLTDQAEAISDTLSAAGLSLTTLINDYWQAPDLRTAWLSITHDLNAINAHFDHWRAIPPNTTQGVTSAEVASATATLSGTLHFSVGCHSGFAVPDEQATAHGQDFPQTMLGRGAVWVANTGFGYGDADAIGYSEQLMLLFTRYLRDGDSVGGALRRAKAEYLNTIGLHSLSPYDEKILAEATLYGLPMLLVQMPGGTAVPLAARSAPEGVSEPLARSAGLTCTVAFRPTYVTHTASVTYTTGLTEIVGTYYGVSLDGGQGKQGEVEVNEGQPIQPRTSVSVALNDTLARGAIFEGGRYQTFHNFDPVVTRVMTDGMHTRPEPGFGFKEWTPSTWDLINSIRTPEGWQQRLVVIPAQYRATTERAGVERRFEVLTYTVYYSMTQDTIPPSIWTVQQIMGTEALTVEVEATDFAGVDRVVAAYTIGDGFWETVDLAQSADPNVWVGVLPSKAGLEYLVQAVDGGGNVAVSDNKGQYFGLPPFRVYLPLVRR